MVKDFADEIGAPEDHCNDCVRYILALFNADDDSTLDIFVSAKICNSESIFHFLSHVVILIVIYKFQFTWHARFAFCARRSFQIHLMVAKVTMWAMLLNRPRSCYQSAQFNSEIKDFLHLLRISRGYSISKETS